MPCPPAWSLPPPCTPVEWHNMPPFEATMPCEHNPVSIFPNAFTYISINGEQVMTLGAVSLVAHTSGVLPIDRGGTGGTTPEQARVNLELGTSATHDSSDYATAAQGARADSAMQPGDDAAGLGSGASTAAAWVLTADGAGGADWAPGASGGGSGQGLTFLPDADLTVAPTGAALTPVAGMFIQHSGSTGAVHAGYVGAAGRTVFTGDQLLYDGAAWVVLRDGNQLAFLPGRAGGQILIGGTGAADKLTLQGTAAAGSPGTAVSIKVGNAGALEAVTVANDGSTRILSTAEQLRLAYDLLNYVSMQVAATGELSIGIDGAAHKLKLAPSGQLTLQGNSTTSGPSFGTELMTSAGWTTAGWVEAPDDVFTHTPGNTTALSHSANIATSTLYNVTWTATPGTAGYFKVSIGGIETAWINGAGSLAIRTLNTNKVTITPQTTYDGAVSLVSVKAITTASTPIFRMLDAVGGIASEIRAYADNNVFHGPGAGQFLTTGRQNNVGAATASMQSLTSGSSNSVGAGHFALSAVTTGGLNSVGAGHSALKANTSGIGNSVGAGSGALAANTTGSNNSVGAGMDALGYNTTGGNNCALGVSAGRYQQAGTTPLTDPENSIYIGYGCRGFDNNDNNSIVIGYNAIGRGANTTVIGSASTGLTALRGTVETSGDFESTGAAAGVILKDTTLGTRHRITLTNGSLVIGPAI